MQRSIKKKLIDMIWAYISANFLENCVFKYLLIIYLCIYINAKCYDMYILLFVFIVIE